MNPDTLQSKTIDFLRFPLIIGVVLIHSQFTELVINGVDMMNGHNFPIYQIVAKLFSDIFSRIAVPLFFFFSGYLFFYHKEFTWHEYGLSLKKRVRTLLIPYLFWNLAIILLFFLAQTFLSSLMSGATKLISDYTLTDWLRAFWNGVDNSFPICYQFWFIRDLMIVSCLSPLIYWLVKGTSWVGVLVLGLLWICDWGPSITGLSSVCLFFFSAGAWFSIRHHNFIKNIRPLLIPSAILYALFCILDLYFNILIIHQVGIIIGMIFLLALTSFMLDKGKWKTNAFLSSASFFIFAYHAMPISLIGKVMFWFYPPQSDLQMVIYYFLRPFIIIVAGLFIYYLLNKYIPSFTRIITGNRNYSSSKPHVISSQQAPKHHD